MEPLISRGRLKFAGQAVRELAEMERSDEASLYIATARLSLGSGQPEAAEESLLAAEQLTGESDPYAADREELWALLHEDRGDRDLAIQSYLRAVILDPTRTNYLRELAELYGLSRQWEEAALWMQRYIQTDPATVAFYWELLGEYLVAAGREVEAVTAFETALDVEPYSYLARLRLAEVLERRGELDAAIELLEFLTVYAIDRNAEIFTRLADLYLRAGRTSDAERVLKKGARVFPSDTAIYKQRLALESSD